MTANISGSAGPAAESFAGTSFAHTIKRLFHSTRPKFFPASVLSVLGGTAWGFQISGEFDAIVFLLALLATMCVHAGANVLNDVGDDAGGTDRHNEDRVYPYTGGSQFIQLNIMSSRSMLRWGITLLTIAAIAGLILFSIKGEMIVWFGVIGLSLAVFYSLGPLRLNSVGLGELSIGAAFGVLPVVGAAWLQSGLIDRDVVLFSLPFSAWVAAILLINEVPDISADGANGKRTLPVRIGLDGTAALYVALHAIAALAVVWLTIDGSLPLATPLLPIALLVLALKSASAIRKGIGDRGGLTGAIEKTLAIHTVGSVWLVGVSLFVAFFDTR